MVEVVAQTKAGSVKINSENVEELLKMKADMDLVKDISDTISQEGLMVFDCKLDKNIFYIESLDEDIIEEYQLDEEYMQVIFEDIQDYLYGVMDDIEHDCQEEYKMDQIKAHCEIYDVDESFTDIKFVVAMSFREIKKPELADLARIVAKRQLEGSSKYFN